MSSPKTLAPHHSPLPLVLGGHSFINQLGNDPPLSPDKQAELVAACLDNGITWFDTTYQPERIALGNALARLGRRNEAAIIAWNFFTDFGPADQVGGPEAYQPHHIERMCKELRTDHIDCLIVHGVADQTENTRQLELAQQWQRQGLVGKLGTWWPPENADVVYANVNPYSVMVRPYNITTVDAVPAFAASKRLNWETFACSPFVRGWELDKMAERASLKEHGAPGKMKENIARLMLRYSLFAPNVDRLIVAMRKVEWVGRNVAAVSAGPPAADEVSWLAELARETEKTV